MKAAYVFTRIVVGLTEISVVQNRDAGGGENRFDVVVDGAVRATVELGKYYPPSIGVYDDKRMAVWAGNRAALETKQADRWSAVDFGEPIHAVYRVSSGWCVVTELTVFTVNESGQVVSELGHGEVIIGSRWTNESLVLEDFEGNVLAVKIDDALAITTATLPPSLDPA
jgi:hypothetical protein